MARLRLARSQNPGDPSHAVLREILRLDRPADAPFSPAARELVLAWFIDQGQIEGVRGFLWHQYGKSLARPLWAETTAALGSADPREAGRLLEQWDERLPRYDRVNLARLAGTPAIAATAAFEAMDLQRDDETSHLQLTEVMLDQADRADLDLAQRQLGSIDETFTGARLDLGLAPRLRLAVELGRVSRQIIDRNYFSALPGLEALAVARLDWIHDDGTTRLAIGRRDSYAGYTPVLVEREQRINRQLSVTATTLNNSGLLQGAQQLDVAAASASNQGQWLTAGNLSATASTLASSGLLQGKTVTLRGNSFDNSGQLLSTTALLSLAKQFTNRQNAKILAQQGLTLSAPSVANSGTLAATALTLSGTDIDNSGMGRINTKGLNNY